MLEIQSLKQKINLLYRLIAKLNLYLSRTQDTDPERVKTELSAIRQALDSIKQ